MDLLTQNRGDYILRATKNVSFEPLITSLVERGAVGMIVAPAKAKKSMLALNLVFSLITKKPFLGLAVSTKPEKILYINLELTKQALGMRINSMNQYYKATDKQLENVYFFNAHEFTNDQPLVDTKAQTVNQAPFERLTKVAKDGGITCIIIDPLYYVVGEENDNVLMTAVMREFSKLRDELNATIFVVHHTAKAHKDWSDPFIAGRGASSLAGAFEFALGIEPVSSTEARLHHGSRNYPSAETLDIRFEAATLTWRSQNEATADKQIDQLMGGKDSMDLVAFCELSKLPRVQVLELIATSQTYEHIKHKKGKPACVARKPVSPH
jgi:AAA domain